MRMWATNNIIERQRLALGLGKIKNNVTQQLRLFNRYILLSLVRAHLAFEIWVAKKRKKLVTFLAKTTKNLLYLIKNDPRLATGHYPVKYHFAKMGKIRVAYVNQLIKQPSLYFVCTCDHRNLQYLAGAILALSKIIYFKKGCCISSQMCYAKKSLQDPKLLNASSRSF